MKCRDPCPGSCASNAICRVVNHRPLCTCLPGYSGDAFSYCRFIQQQRKPFLFLSNILFPLLSCNTYTQPKTLTITAPEEVNPCIPSPCGPNSICRTSNGKASCSCSPPNIEGPNGCRPECVSNSECPSNRACINQKCQDPCPGVCGISARCETMNHSPICSCSPEESGDPFVKCFRIPSEFQKKILPSL